MDWKDKEILVYINGMLDAVKETFDSYQKQITDLITNNAPSEDVAELTDNLNESISGTNGGDIGNTLSILSERLQEYLEIESL